MLLKQNRHGRRCGLVGVGSIGNWTVASLGIGVRGAHLAPRRTILPYLLQLTPFRRLTLPLSAIFLIILTRQMTPCAQPSFSAGTLTSFLVHRGAVVAVNGTGTIFSRTGTLTITQFVLAPSGTASASRARRTLLVGMVDQFIYRAIHEVVADENRTAVFTVPKAGKRRAVSIGAANVATCGPDDGCVVTANFASRAFGRLVVIVLFLVVPQLHSEQGLHENIKE